MCDVKDVRESLGDRLFYSGGEGLSRKRVKKGFFFNLYPAKRGTCIKGLFWPPMRSKNKSCFSQVSSY